MSRDVFIVDTGSANLASVGAAFRRAGAAPKVTADPDDVRAARCVVLPGVGAFGAVMQRLQSAGIADALRERVDAGGSLLAICLGMQLLARESEETPGATGLGVFGARVRRLTDVARIPQLGWNEVVPDEGASGVTRGYAYFANSYVLTEAEHGWTPAWSVYGAPFVAAIERGTQLACQFHPELSGAWGGALIRRWMERC